MTRPDRAIVRRARLAMGKQCVPFRDGFSFHEQLAEGRVGQVGAMGRERQFYVARQFQARRRFE